jgi:hypothetical protein
MVKRLIELFERLAAELPIGTASMNFYDVPGGQGTVVELRPANPDHISTTDHVRGVPGYLVSRFGSYNLPFIPMAALLLIGAWLWIQVDPTQQLVPEAKTVVGVSG